MKDLKIILEKHLKKLINLERLIKKYYVRYKDKKKISIFYNFGFGINMFRSINRTKLHPVVLLKI